MEDEAVVREREEWSALELWVGREGEREDSRSRFESSSGIVSIEDENVFLE